MDLPLLFGSTAARYLPLAGWLGKPLDVAYSRCSRGRTRGSSRGDATAACALPDRVCTLVTPAPADPPPTHPGIDRRLGRLNGTFFNKGWVRAAAMGLMVLGSTVCDQHLVAASRGVGRRRRW